PGPLSRTCPGGPCRYKIPSLPPRRRRWQERRSMRMSSAGPSLEELGAQACATMRASGHHAPMLVIEGAQPEEGVLFVLLANLPEVVSRHDAFFQLGQRLAQGDWQAGQRPMERLRAVTSITEAWLAWLAQDPELLAAHPRLPDESAAAWERRLYAALPGALATHAPRVEALVLCRLEPAAGGAAPTP